MSHVNSHANSVILDTTINRNKTTHQTFHLKKIIWLKIIFECEFASFDHMTKNNIVVILIILIDSRL